MKERPILFTAPMVRAILNGQKTQTRRMVKYIPALGEPDNWCPRIRNIKAFIGDPSQYCPFGLPGDRLWVRETWNGNKEVGLAYRATNPELNGCPWRPSIYMPRWASRITLEIVSVRVERLNEISADDVMAEGIDLMAKLPHPLTVKIDNPYKLIKTIAQSLYRDLWDTINGKKHPWDSNPWVWVIEFKRVYDVIPADLCRG